MSAGNIEITLNVEAPDVDIDTLRDLVMSVLDRYDATDATVSISIVGDEIITQVHQQFLGDEKTTDVISFDLSEAESENERIFDLVVNYEMASRQAQQRSHDAQAELALYITHGLLHNLGFDDIDPADAEKMHKAEDEILQTAGFGVVYAARPKES
ncbi:Endoribonuclease YbeY [Anaerohalosphaera lusitana]|uniref:Endoribonuclease YbeY n=1 Tax=Anaerohalosphaera lusitana TaxID=1936003 RepID=A0A1U9NJC9_9BACT|nr:rRNA maturation RNase YbeY [Anaerohalosphaera lusitana]AQT67626.1 Endoribonuclease YbeY [Anaerohalosphaera lusitana]